MFKGEKIYTGEKKVKYLFQKSYEKVDGLVVVFSAFSKIGTKPSYNYIRTLEEFDCNKLFILDDFGARGTYYLCENRDFSIERSIIGLINEIIEENGIDYVITCGSSKGGYSALYYGIKYGFNNIIAASPQYFIGDYLLKETNTSQSAQFMSGGIDEEDCIFLNSIMSQMIVDSNYKPNIFIHLGKGEYHYQSHVMPMLDKFNSVNMEYELDLADYSEHSDVSKFYPQILKDRVRSTLDYPSLKIEQLNKSVQVSDFIEFKAITNAYNDKVAWYIYFNNQKISQTKYSKKKRLKFKINKRGKYFVKAFVMNQKKHKVSLRSNNIVVG